MRRLAATALLVVCAGLGSGCAVIDAAQDAAGPQQEPLQADDLREPDRPEESGAPDETVPPEDASATTATSETSELGATPASVEAAESVEETGAVVPEGFRVFTGDGYRVALPCTPVEQTLPLTLAPGAEVEAHMMSCASSEVAFGVSTATFPRGIALDLDGASLGSARQAGGILVANETVTYQGLPGRDITIRIERNGQTAMGFGRALLHGRTLVHVQVVVISDAPEPPSDYPKILGSLVLE